MKNNRRVCLGDIAKIKHGFAFSGEFFSDHPTDFELITPGNFQIGGGFKSDKPKFYNGPVPEEYVLSEGDLVITMTDLSKAMDTLGCAGVIPVLPNGRIPLHNQRIGKVELSSPDVDLKWLSFRLRAKDYLAEVRAGATGSTVHHTAPSRLEKFVFDLPPLETQKKIAKSLELIENKISSNKKMQRSCLDLLNLSTEQYSSGAEHKPLFQVANIVLGGTPSKKSPEFWADGTVNWINSGQANLEIVTKPTHKITELGLANSAAKLMPKGATVVAITGATLGQVALLAIETSGNQSLIGVWGDDETSSAWLHLEIKRAIPELLKSATGAAQQHVNKADVEGLIVSIPKDKDLKEWGISAIPLLRLALQIAQENEVLESLLDELLPELIFERKTVGEY